MLVCKHDGIRVHPGHNGMYFHDNPYPLLRTIARDVEDDAERTRRKMDEAGTLPVRVELDIAYNKLFETRPKIRNHELHPKGVAV